MLCLNYPKICAFSIEADWNDQFSVYFYFISKEENMKFLQNFGSVMLPVAI